MPGRCLIFLFMLDMLDRCLIYSLVVYDMLGRCSAECRFVSGLGPIFDVWQMLDRLLVLMRGSARGAAQAALALLHVVTHQLILAVVLLVKQPVISHRHVVVCWWCGWW